MPESPEFIPTDTPASLSHRLDQILVEVDQGNFTRGEAIDRLAERGFGFILILLSFPSALPVPAPGYSTPFGVILFLFGIQMAFNRKKVWLPQKIRAKPAEGKRLRQVLAGAGKFFKATEKWVKPRYAWASTPLVYCLLGVVVSVMSVLMILPIPLTNTLPAIVIFLIGVGWCEKDGLVLVLASILGVLSVALYATLITLLIIYGERGMDILKDAVRGLFGS